MSSLKILTAVAAAATFSLAFAQGTPPQPASNPAVGQGQQSSQSTPMGSTGTPGGSGTAAQGSTAGSTAGSTGTSSGTMSSGSTAGATSGSGTMSSDTGATTTRRARADRN
ncbi:hypothetical protein [Ramlibacter pallidus]|uniref:Proteophosphoglycan ppg4 n=1 Tax=Ramlibacter pallidus TaxID=2780087 RepID=A0ABR9S4U4_9BURK|nr:hypothetical protein [Ramlibacter pallidus]MBE7368531.1 hypothetical protein [Ramlibacter pallidus]